MFQVFSRHAGDKLAEQPRGPDPPEDGRGRHLRSGGQGQDAARALCISALQRKIVGHLSGRRRRGLLHLGDADTSVCQLCGLT